MSTTATAKNRYHLSRPDRLRKVTSGPRILCQTRIKNEARWIQQVLDSMATVAHGIVIIDDGSTDETPAICKAHPAVVEYIWQDHPIQDQVRDKDEALALSLTYEPEWMLCLDGDEVLEQTAALRIADAIAECPQDVSTFAFNFLYMWNDLQHYRVDGPYTRIFHPRMFRVAGQVSENLRYTPTTYAGNGHCKSVPGSLTGKTIELDLNVLHLGYMYEEVRRERFERYRNRDPEQFATGYYNHLLDQPGMVIKEWRERLYTSKSAEANGPRKQMLKADFYYANVRENLVNLIPETARTILDVGCGQAALGGFIKSKRAVEVVGIEIQPEVAEVARTRIDRVLEGDIEHMKLPYNQGYFDCIVLADVLEHLIDPWAALKKLTSYLSPTGMMVISLPNIRNAGVIRGLIEGSWTYQEWGILDSTHLRFFALSNMRELFSKAGLEAELVETIRDPQFEAAMKNPPTGKQNIVLGDLVINNVSPANLNELTAQQFVFIARTTNQVKTNNTSKTILAQPTPKPLVSIVIPVYNHIELTRQCITSIFATRGARTFEVIIFDDGSTDGTADYARALGSAVVLTQSAQNSGFAAACNRGAIVAQGEYLLFLNNDTIVESGWLDEMVNAMERDSSIGVVGNRQLFPNGMTQQAGNVVGRDGNFYSLYHNILPGNHPAVSKAREFQFVAGSCLLTPASLFETLNGFDEGYINSYEDADYCLRVRAHGKKVWYCPQSTIQHLESQTVAGHAKSGPNHERFMNRWHDSLKQDDEFYYIEDGFVVNDMLKKHGKPSKSGVTEITKVVTSMEGVPMDKKRIAILTTWNQRCGLALYATSMVKQLQANGFSPLIVAEQSADIIGRDEDNVRRCWSRSQVDFTELLSTLELHKISLLHINHGGMFALEGWLTAFMREVRMRGIRIVTTFHSTESIAEEFGTRARLSDHCIVHHGQNEIELVALGGYPARTTVLSLPLNAIQRVDLSEAKMAVGFDLECASVSTVGFVDPHKGILELIEAVAKLQKDLPVNLTILGIAHPNNEQGAAYLQTCRQRAVEMGIAKRVTFANGFLTDEERDAHLRASDVIVLNYQSARFEASAALMTALESGRPVITSSVPSLETEFACTLKTTEEFTLYRLLDITIKNPFIARTLRENAERMSEKNSWQKAGQTIAALYNKVLTEHAAPDAELAKYYMTHPDAIYREPLQRERVRWLKQRARGKILEIGPANGYVTEFTGASHAIDIYEGRLHVCRALRPGITFEYGDVVKGLKYDRGAFDCVMAPEILEHVDFDEAITALRECLRVGNSVLITVPSCDKPDYNPDLVHNPEHRWMVTREAVENLLTEAGATSWTIDVSSGLEFYLIETTSAVTKTTKNETAGARNIRLSKRPWVKTLRVAVDSAALFEAGTRTRGIGRYFVEQFRALALACPDWEFIFLGPDAGHTRTRITEDIKIERFRTAVWADLKATEYDLMYLPHPVGPATAPLLRLASQHERPVACTFYDLIPLIYPQAYLTPDQRYKQHYSSTMGMLREHCDLFLCISQCTAEDLRRHLGIGLERLRTIHAGVSTRFGDQRNVPADNELTRSLLKSSEPYLLFVGVPDARKNAGAMMLSVAAASAALRQPLKLVIAGSIPNGMENQLRALQERTGLNAEQLVVTGYVSDSDLGLLYRHAHATLFPSLYEGFGFPIVEAMTAGCPVIAGANSSQPEVAGDAALLVNAQDVEAIAAAILKISVEPGLRERLVKDGYQRAQKFTWKKVAEKTAMYLREFMTRQGMHASQSHEKSTEKHGVLETMS